MTTTVELVPMVLNGRYPLVLPAHRAAREEWASGWEEVRIESMHDTLRPGDLIFDIGSEEGDMPGLWASWGCRVVLVESTERVWSNIRTVFEANDLTPAGWFMGFAGHEERRGSGTQRAHAEEVDGWPRCAYGPVIGDHGFSASHERPDIPMTTIDALAERFGPPDALTLDVEGAEMPVLQGATRVLYEARPLVWVSEHPMPGFREPYDYTQDDLEEFMTALGYDRTHLATDHEVHALYTPSETA